MGPVSPTTQARPAGDTAKHPATGPGEFAVRSNHRGYWVLLAAICSWAACPILGGLAWMMANHDLKEMQDGRMDPAGEPETTMALYLGMSHVIVSAAILVIGLVGGALALALR